ncbi:ABC transporter substrate binding protein [Gorillibacterium sp. sgz500922]|uniref:ABC transporter substrate binding protein n=1 Tax=Gorillibacterium sp. sgz500922 TaxID=3446694 RepID=UPI003F681B7E
MKRTLRFLKPAILLAALLLPSLLLLLPHAAAESDLPETPRILILNSYHKGLEWTDEQTEGFSKRIKQSKGYAVLYTEYMDWKRYPDLLNLDFFFERMQAKYQSVPLDLVMATDDVALEFALKNRSRLFSGAPIVFSGINEVSAERLTRGYSNVTGVLETIDPTGTLKAALQVNPKLKKVYVLFDNSESGASTGEIVLNTLRKQFPQLTGIPMNGLTRTELLDLAKTLPGDSIVLATTYFQDSTGTPLEFDALVKDLSRVSKVPVYHIYNFGMDNGGFGGSLISGDRQGEAAANLGLRILNGEPASGIPFNAGYTNRLAFDYKELKRFGVPVSRLPEGSEILNRPFSFYRTYRTLVIGTVAAFAVLLLFIAILLFYVDQVRRIRRKLEQSNERFALATNGSAAVIWDLDMMKQQYYFSEIWYELLGYERGELDEERGGWREIIHPDDRPVEARNKREHLNGKTPYYFCEYRLLSKAGIYKWFQVKGKVLRDDHGVPIRFAGSMTDVSDRKDFEVRLQDSYQELESTYEELTAVQAELLEQYNKLVENQTMLIRSEEKYRELAYNDTLSGLPNKRSLIEALARFTEENKRAAAALLFLDLDNFKYINDTMGHSIGDQLLAAFSERIAGLAGPRQDHYRFGGDEYVIFMRDIASKQEALDLAERLLQAVKEPFVLHGSLLHVSVSIGIACFPENGTTADELLQKADVAMYRAKEAGKAGYVLYEQEMQHVFDERMRIERHLRDAMGRNELKLYYQPIADIASGEVWGFEALLRWDSPELGFVSPLTFVGVAEDCRLIIPIGEWVLTSACRFMTSLHETGHRPYIVSVNISLIQLIQEDFLEMVGKVLTHTGLDPSRLQLEITESIFMESFEAIMNKLEFLQQLGVRIALDDFGTGYSSLSYLKQLPITSLKIDKSFIDALGGEHSGEPLAQSIVSIGHNLGLEVTAEGVETGAQLEDLKRMNCDKIQGYYISKPIPEERVPIWIQASCGERGGTEAG